MTDTAQSSKLTTDEERRQLAEKLDKDLEEFINSREKKPYTEGWKEDDWEREMEQHPFFMKKLPEEGEPLPPLLEAFQQLKYDPEENTAEELALAYKEDGNFNFKMKKYRFAIANYTEGLKQNCTNNDLNATLYFNRAVSQYYLQNFRSSLNDCVQAAKLKPDYTKAICRAAQCCQQLNRYEEGLKWCDYGLKLNATEELLVKIRTDLIQKQKIDERNQRKNALALKKEQLKEEGLINAILARGIRTKSKHGKGVNLDLQSLEPCHPAAIGKRVHLESDSLIWPVIFLYPEYGETDFIQEFNEQSRFIDHIIDMFQELPPWDLDRKYLPENIDVYYEDVEKAKLYLVDKESTLKEILSQETYTVRAGTPGFILLVKGSEAQTKFLECYSFQN